MNNLNNMTTNEIQEAWKTGDIGTDEIILEIIRRLEIAESRTNRMLTDLDEVWSFDNDKVHTHTWYTKNDFIYKWSPRKRKLCDGG